MTPSVESSAGTCPSREAERSIDHILSRGDISPQRFVTVIDRGALDKRPLPALLRF